MKTRLLILLVCSSLLYGQPPQEFRAVKLTNVDSNVLFTDQNIASAMDYLASIGVNVVLPVVWNGAYTQYQSAVMDSIFGVRIHPQFAGRDPLDRVVIEAHRVGIEVYPWFEYGFAAWYSGNGTPTGGHIIKRFPQWALRTSNGAICNKNGFDWMSAINPEVQTFIDRLVMEVITTYDVDGVEFSDRIPAMPVEGGYDSVTVALYKKEHAGSAPPADFSDAGWMRWRADQMNHWYSGIRAIIKAKDPALFVSSSPSIYPWSYQEYLQDSKQWIDNGTADHFIPQLYRYTFDEYRYELKNAITQVGSQKHKLFPGILMNIGTGANEYVMSPAFLMNVLKENRANGVNGEAFFYYEGLRKNNGLLGDTLRKTYYHDRAVVPGRGGAEWRFPAAVANEDDAAVQRTGEWSTYAMKGFTGAVLRTNDSTGTSSIAYRLTIPVPGYYDVFVYRVPNTPWTTKARYTVLGSKDTTISIIDQSDLSRKGWYRLATIALDSGMRKVVELRKDAVDAGTYLVADAVMASINRSAGHDHPLEVEGQRAVAARIPSGIQLLQNFPNPFNPATTIRYSIPALSSGEDQVTAVQLRVFDVLGRLTATVVNEVQSPGSYSVPFNATSLSSGVYFYRLQYGATVLTRRMTVLK